MISALQGAGYCLKGFRWCFRKSLRRYIVPPLLMNIAFMGLILFLGGYWLSPIVNELQTWLPDWLQWLEWLLIVFYFMAVIWAGFILLSVAMHLFAAPFNDALSVAVERAIKNDASKGSPLPRQSLVRQVSHTVVDSAARGFYALKWLVLVGGLAFFLSFIPLLNLLVPWMTLALGGWLLSLEYFDYPLARKGHVFKKQVSLLSKKRFSVIGFGAMVGLLLAVPVVNLFVIPGAVIGATIFCAENAGMCDE